MSERALDFMWALRLENGRTWGECAADFQVEDADAIFADEGPNLHFLTRPRGGSKPLALDTPLPTPTSWTTMGELSTGDWLLDDEGHPCQVTRLGEVKLDEPCYRVEFDDGTSIVASADHEWVAEDQHARARRGFRNARRGHPKRPGTVSAHGLPGGLGAVPTVTTEQMAQTLRYGPRGDLSWSVPCARTWELPEVELPLPPYVLGAWLGDGTSETSRITVGTQDEAQLAAKFESLGFPLHSPVGGLTWRFGHPVGERSNGRGPKTYDSTRTLRELGVLHNKHIPMLYLRASAKQRLELLRGLMDSDGHAFPDKGQVQFTSTSKVLAGQVAELVVSLGWKVRVREHRAKIYTKDCGPVYCVVYRPDESPFSLERKTALWEVKRTQASRHTSRMVRNIVSVPSVPVRCITVNSLTHLYLAGRSGIPTHNSTDLAAVVLAWLAVDAPPMANGHVVASNTEQAAILIDAAAGFVARTPQLSGVIHVENERLIAENGAWVRVLAQSASGSWGLRDAHILICDEFCQWDETRGAKRVWTAMRSTVQKVPGCRLIILSSAGEPSHWSRPIFENAQKSKLWRVSETPGPIPWQRPEDIEGLKHELLPSEYERLVLNIWSESEDRAISPEDFARAEQTCWKSGIAPAGLKGGGIRTREPHVSHKYILTVDIGIKNDATVLAVSHKELIDPTNPKNPPRLVVDHIDRWEGSKRHHVQLESVTERIVALAMEYLGARVYVDPYQFVSGVQALNRRGVRAEEWLFTATSVGQVATSLVQAFHNGQIHVPSHEPLRTELLTVKLRESAPGVTRLFHDKDKHDDQAVALGMAAHILLGGAQWGQGAAWLEAMKAKLQDQADHPEKYETQGDPMQSFLSSGGANSPARALRACIAPRFFGPERLCGNCGSPPESHAVGRTA